MSLNTKDKKRTQIPEEYPYKIVDIKTGTSEISKVKNGKAGIKGILIKNATKTEAITKITFCNSIVILLRLILPHLILHTSSNHTKYSFCMVGYQCN